MKNQNINNEDRNRIVQAYINGNSASDLSSIFGFKRTTIYSIIKKYKNHEPIEKKQRGGQRRKSLSEQDKGAIRGWIDENCALTLKEIKSKIELERGVVVSQSTINRCISGFNYSMKRINIMPIKRNNMEVISLRAQYANRFMELLSTIDDSKIFFIDEVGFNVSIRSRRGRSLKNKRAVQNVSSIRARNISVCCAMNKDGIFKYLTQTKSYNTQSFLGFIRLIIEKMSTLNISGAIFVMDNVPFHKNNAIKEEIEISGHRILFLPPYSPFLNPIENLFSKWKQFIRCSRPEGEDQLFENIENGSSLISSDDCKNYFRHM
ncbi:hypothetical protein DMUE_5992, partial [Dictyocoela muelleri]